MQDSYRNRTIKQRVIPKSTQIHVQAETNHRGELSPKDRNTLISLSEELLRLGVTRPVQTMQGLKTEQEITDVLLEAENSSVAEEELNPDYHDAKLDEELMTREGISNPLMEKFDDYEGVDYNPAFRARSQFEALVEGSSKVQSRKRKKRTL